MFFLAPPKLIDYTYEKEYQAKYSVPGLSTVKYSVIALLYNRRDLYIYVYLVRLHLGNILNYFLNA